MYWYGKSYYRFIVEWKKKNLGVFSAIIYVKNGQGIRSNINMCLDMHVKAMKEYILQLIAVIRQKRMRSEQVGARVWGEKNAHFFSYLVFNPYELAWILKIKIKNLDMITFSQGIFLHCILLITFRDNPPCLLWVPAR